MAVALGCRVEYPKMRIRQDHVFPRSPVRIGRNELNDLHLKSGYVSQMHSVIQWDETAIEYLDLGSTNGTMLNGVRIQSYVPTHIRVGDTVSIGPILLTFSYTEAVEEDEIPEGGTAIDADATQHLQAAHTAAEQVGPAYQAYRNAWAQTLGVVRQILEPANPQVRMLVVSMLKDRAPALVNEPEYQQLISALQIDQVGQASIGVGELAQALNLTEVQGRQVPQGGELLHMVSKVLQAFCTSFVELRNGFDQFSNELAVRTFQHKTPLHQAEDGLQILGYLVEQPTDGGDRVQDLKSAFADMMIHQVALISGVMEGVRGLLHKIGPEAIADEVKKKSGPLARIWPMSVFAAWGRYAKMHAEMMEEDQEITSVLFGRDFARSYGATKGSAQQPKQAPGHTVQVQLPPGQQ